MGKTVITKSTPAKGDIGAVYDLVLKKLHELGYEDTSTIWPTEIVAKRGKGGMFAKSLDDAKTEIKTTLVQSSENVNIMFEYTLNVPSSFVDKDDNIIEKEFKKLKHELSGTMSQKAKLCDVCLSPINADENFCRSCGRSATKSKNSESGEQEVIFDSNKIHFGIKMVDDALYGGIPKNSVVLITSPASEEKDNLLTKFVESGLDENGIVIYLASDFKMAQNDRISNNPEFFEIICNAQAEVRRTEQKGDMHCIKISGVERLNELTSSITTMLGNVSKQDDFDNKQKRIVIDVLSDMLLSNQSVNTRKWLRETITKLKAKGFTILALLNPHMHTKEDTQALLDLFDGQINIYEKEIHGNSRFFMQVKRMNNSKYSSKETILIKENLTIETSE